MNLLLVVSMSKKIQQVNHTKYIKYISNMQYNVDLYVLYQSVLGLYD